MLTVGCTQAEIDEITRRSVDLGAAVDLSSDTSHREELASLDDNGAIL